MHWYERLAAAVEHRFAAVVCLVLVLLAAAQVTSISQESQTYDEGAHLVAGYSYWKTGSFALNPEHPPLAKLLAALPLLALRPLLPTALPDWQMREYDAGVAFLYSNRVPADKLLFYGRLGAIVSTLGLALALALWTAARFNRSAALCVLILFAFDPVVIAFGRYVDTDTAVTLFSFCACILWGAYLQAPTRGRLWAAGAALGLALLSKFSAIVLLPVFLSLYLVRWWQQGVEPAQPGLARFSLRGFVLTHAAVIGIALLTVYAGYGFETETLLSQPLVRARFEHSMGDLKTKLPPALSSFADPAKAQGRIVLAAVRSIPVPARSYFYGLYRTVRDTSEGRPTFVAGRQLPHGVWYYFPYAFSVKEPVGTLVLLALMLAAVLRAAFSRGARECLTRLRRADFSWYILAAPLLFYVLALLRAPLNIGIRHMLPVYPFVFVLIAAGWNATKSARSYRWARPVQVVCLLAVAAESLAAYPFYLPFFNFAVGGSAAGVRYLGDSNVDWGQEVRRLKLYQDAHPGVKFCVKNWDIPNLDYYGIRHDPVPTTADADPARQCNCVVAISAALLNSLGREYVWLKPYRPFDRIGNAMWLYDLRWESKTAAPPPVHPSPEPTSK